MMQQECLESNRFYNEYTMRENNLANAAVNIVSCFSSLFQQITAIVSILVIISSINILFALITVIPIVIDLFLSLYVNKLHIEEQIEQRTIDRKSSILSRVFYQYNSLREIKNFNAEKPVIAKLADTLERRRLIHIAYYKKSTLISLISGILKETAPIISMILFGFYVFKGQITISEYYVFIALYEQLKQSIASILAIVPQINKIQLWITDYYQYMDDTSRVEKNLESGETISDFESIEFRNVSFRYDQSDIYALRDINLTINKLETTMIIGMNGSGKSTLMKLLCGLYKPTEGEIILNGKNIDCYNKHSLHAMISVLFQDYYMFPFTIRENITMFNQAVSETEKTAYELVELFSLNKRIEALPETYDTGIKGEFCDTYTDLSGGELQKLAIVRTFSKTGRKMLLFDEPLNNIDLETENSFYELFLNEKCTSIIISHSLKLAPHVKKIVYMQNGTIKAVGNHSEMLSTDADYKKMYEKYATKYFK
jgi:ABC-type multidrug transport system fused ATPase/permease subunit